MSQEMNANNSVESTATVQTQTPPPPPVNNKQSKSDGSGYPQKTTINLRYSKDRTTRPATIALYALLGMVVLVLFGKQAIYTPLVNLREQKAILEQKQAAVQAQIEALANYEQVRGQYVRFSTNFKTGAEQICDRIDILNMMEQTVFLKSAMNVMQVGDDLIQLELENVNLEGIAALTREIEEYDFVESVTLSTATLDREHGRNMVTTMFIELKSEELAE